MSDINPIYIFDTSAIIDMHKFYPINRDFPYWRNVEISINDGKFKTPFLVLEDVSRKDDLIKGWFNKCSTKMMIPQTNFQNITAKEIERDYPKLVNYRFGRINADPFVIACALEINKENQTRLFPKDLFPVIVAQEGEKKKDSITKVCGKIGLTCITIDQLWGRENWVVV